MSEKLIEVARFNFPTDPAFLLFISYLESEHIPYACPERMTLETQPFMSIGLGGMRVFVHEEHAERPKTLFGSIEKPDEEETALAKEQNQNQELKESGTWHYFKLLAVMGLALYLIYRLMR